jgi:hypothetical protein
LPPYPPCGETPPAAHGALPGLIVATYVSTEPGQTLSPGVTVSKITGTRIYDPARGRYVALTGRDWLPATSPDLRWTALYKDTFNQVRIGSPGQSADAHAGQVDPASIRAWTAAPGPARWSDDSSRYYLAGRTATGARLLGIDPATRAVVSTTDLALPGAGQDWDLVSADRRDGFMVLDHAGILHTFSPAGAPLGTRRVAEPLPPNVAMWRGGLVSPDHTRLTVSARDGEHILDLRTGRTVRSPGRGRVSAWADADHYVSVDGDHREAYLVDAGTGKVVGTAPLPSTAGTNGTDLLPLVGPAPPGAVTITF